MSNGDDMFRAWIRLFPYVSLGLCFIRAKKKINYIRNQILGFPSACIWKPSSVRFNSVFYRDYDQFRLGSTTIF
ncbi:hypothetical protein KUTeg_021350 [Tegillarca granosa]|uniref:Uncharacterized protein n=1 Tax=Tegillarca granosa TaxID=220873 RepID=A0ABQ9EAK1_TEGGR|nr:hypothetical protein KUTeg_021350 [Tegillarca granosa]